MYRAVTHPWLASTGNEDGLVLNRFDRFLFYADAKGSETHEYLLGTYEPVTTLVFERLVAPGDMVVDVGAHWGYFTLVAATLCGETGRVIAFEPDPRNVSILTKNLQANHLVNVDVVQKAVSDRKGPAKLFLSRDSSGNSLDSVPPGAELSLGQNDHLAVETVTLDGFLAPPCRKPSLVKVDIEGGELAVLEGMKTLIRETGDLALITEFNPFYFAGARGEAFLKMLTEQDFQLAILDDAKFQIEVGAVQQVSGRALDKSYKINLLCARDGRMERALSPVTGSGAPRRAVPKVVRL
jgi:FkbM family methyltransferase